LQAYLAIGAAFFFGILIGIFVVPLFHLFYGSLVAIAILILSLMKAKIEGGVPWVAVVSFMLGICSGILLFMNYVGILPVL
jgi:hypothetical protein